jgi:hypothetical protein
MQQITLMMEEIISREIFNQFLSEKSHKEKDRDYLWVKYRTSNPFYVYVMPARTIQVDDEMSDSMDF